MKTNIQFNRMSKSIVIASAIYLFSLGVLAQSAQTDSKASVNSISSDLKLRSSKRAPYTRKCTNNRALKVISDFNHGSLQGWRGVNAVDPTGPFNGVLSVESAGGNPGGFMRGEDTISAGGPITALATASVFQPALVGNLAQLQFIQWDSLIPSNARKSPSVWVEGADGTLFNSSSSSMPAGRWLTKSASFTRENGWTRIAGSASFSTVMANAVALYIDMDSVNGVGQEAGIDNVSICVGSEPDVRCPTRNDLSYMNEGGGGLCTTGQAIINGANQELTSHVNWRWALGGYSGEIPFAGTTTPIYYPSGNWNNHYIAVCATLVSKNGKTCPEVCKNTLLDCGDSGGGGPR